MILFHIILIKTTCFNFLLLSQLEVTLLGVIFSSAIWRALPKKWNACSNGLFKNREIHFSKCPHFSLLFYFSHKKNLNLNLLFFN
jgi:hypothetical protein